MVSPLKTDKIPSPTTKQSTQIDPRSGGVGLRNTNTETETRVPASTDDSVDVSSTGRFYSEAAGKTAETNGSVTGQEQATGLAALVRQQLEEGGMQALVAQAGMKQDHVASLLEASGGL